LAAPGSHVLTVYPFTASGETVRVNARETA